MRSVLRTLLAEAEPICQRHHKQEGADTGVEHTLCHHFILRSKVPIRPAQHGKTDKQNNNTDFVSLPHSIRKQFTRRKYTCRRVQ